MELFERKIVIKRFISQIDADNDGFVDSIGLISKDVYIPITLTQSIKNLGVYTDDEEDDGTQILDLSSVWDSSNDGNSDSGSDIDGTIDNPYETNLEVGGIGGDIVGCMDPLALNYSPAVTLPCTDCCQYTEGFEGGNFGDGSGAGATSIGACMRLSSGCQSKDWFIFGNPTASYLLDAAASANSWCSATHPSCGNAYPIVNGCSGNGCGGDVCCPGPINTYVVFGQNNTGCGDSDDCNGTGCGCGNGNPFEGIILKETNTTGCASGLKRHIWEFYCVPDISGGPGI